MKSTFKRALAAVSALAVGAGVGPFLMTQPAAALGTQVGDAAVRSQAGGAALQSGDSATTFTLRLPAQASCPGDSANAGWRWQTYMVSGAINPNTLTFGSIGPSGSNVGNYATFKQPLYTVNGNVIVNRQTADAVPAGGPGPILNIPDMNLSVFEPGNVPAGVYNLGIACTYGPASSTQMSSFWNIQIRVIQDAAGGPAQVRFEVVRPAVTGLTAVPSAPNSITLNWADAPQLAADTYNVAYCTAPATNPCTSSSAGYVATENTGQTSGGKIGPLTPGQPYSFTVTYGAPGSSLSATKVATPKCDSGPVSEPASGLNASLEPVACAVEGLGL